VPQSRPRLFMVGVREDLQIDPALVAPGPIAPFHTRSLCKAVAAVPDAAQAKHLWWNLPTPGHRNSAFADLIEDQPVGVTWRSDEDTQQILALMSPVHLAKVEAAKRAGRRMVGGVYRRTRPTSDGGRVQRAEVRFDDVAGCLRTPAGGSSRQTILVVDGQRVRSRLISPRETARLMGLEDSYILPRTYSDAYHLTGDGVVAPVVRHLAHHILEPLLGLGEVGRTLQAA
jgi:DNA (cytosine-5)-methyltransferase 1